MLDQGIEGSIHLTRPSIPNSLKLMFLKEEAKGPNEDLDSPNEDLDSYLYQDKSFKLKHIIIFENFLNKMKVYKFDGSNPTASACLQKLKTYFIIFPMKEIDAFWFASLYLEGITYELWYNGFTTLGHENII